MQAGQELLLDLLGGHNQQFDIPLYQRRYSWTDAQRQQLWNDILAVAEKPKSRKHFTGSVVYTEPRGGMGSKTLHQSRLIDGQQRVTTTTLLLQALTEHLTAHPDTAQKLGITADEIRSAYLLNEDLSGDKRFKLSLSYADEPTLQAILTDAPLPKQPAQEVRDGVQFFRDRLKEPGLDIAKVWKGLRKLEVVQITLTEGVDDLGLIFESLNSTGKALAQADLIRNNILMGLDEDEQEELSDSLWQPMERLFAGSEEGTFDRFMRDFLTMRTRTLPNEDEVYAAFKDYRQGRPVDEKVETLVEDISRMAQHYLKVIKPEQEENPAVRQALQDLLALRLKVIQPFVLELLQDREQGLLDHISLERALRVIEAFLMRRAVLGERTSPLNRFFATLGRDLPKQEDYVLELERALIRFQDRDRDGFPVDDAFRQALQNEPLYSRPVCKPLLVRLERNRNTKEKFDGQLTIEHVMPQKPGEEWQVALGKEGPEDTRWKADHERLVHRLGNLTLTGYNSELGNLPFKDKKTMPPKVGDDEHSAQPKGYKYSRLLLTQEIADDQKYPVWNQAVIEQRGAALAEEAVHLFPFPKHLEAELDKLREEGRQRSRIPTLEAHLDTSGQALRALYMNLRSRLLKLSEEVTEEPKKYYIAYKVGSNFCDMVPQPALNTIKCWLNVPADRLDDPAGLAEDIGDKGKVGNGNLELVIGLHSNLDEFERLAKQAMDYQIERKARSGAVSSDSSGPTVDFSGTSAAGLELLENLEARCQALGIQTKDRQYYRAFFDRRVFMEVYPRSEGIRLALKLSFDELDAEQKKNWLYHGTNTGYLQRTVQSQAELDDAWSAIQLAYERQLAANQPTLTVAEFIDAQAAKVQEIIRGALEVVEDLPACRERMNPAQKSFTVDTAVGTKWKPVMEIDPRPDGRVRIYLYASPDAVSKLGLQDAVQIRQGFLTIFLEELEDVATFAPLIRATYDERHSQVKPVSSQPEGATTEDAQL